jgi:hypothetical protein
MKQVAPYRFNLFCRAILAYEKYAYMSLLNTIELIRSIIQMKQRIEHMIHIPIEQQSWYGLQDAQDSVGLCFSYMISKFVVDSTCSLCKDLLCQTKIASGDNLRVRQQRISLKPIISVRLCQ